MLEHISQHGLESLELGLRTSFLNKMVANQERTIVEQTIRFENADFISRPTTSCLTPIIIFLNFY